MFRGRIIKISTHKKIIVPKLPQQNRVDTTRNLKSTFKNLLKKIIYNCTVMIAQNLNPKRSLQEYKVYIEIFAIVFFYKLR